jgi:ArsR family transcriptional regulator, arsenate/arsenite/antimonite-responsive transcriptional repressor
MDELLKIAKALSDKNRVRILNMLEVKPLCVCEITEILGIATSTASSHLSVLREAGFITDEKDGKWINYSIQTDSKSQVITDMLALLPSWLKNDSIVDADLKKIGVTDRYTITMSLPKAEVV